MGNLGYILYKYQTPQMSRPEKKDEPAVATLKVTFPSRELRERFKAVCALDGKNMNEAIIEFIEQSVEHKYSPSAKNEDAA
jgi:hypothetical protein